MIMELDIRQVLTILWRRVWVLILFMFVIGAAAFSISKWLITPMYSASASMYVFNQQDRTSTISQTDLTASQKLVSTYIVILSSNSVLEQVSEKLDNRYSVEQIRNMLSASSINDTEAFRITINNPNPQVAQEIANTIADVVPQEITRVVKAGAVEVIDRATLPQAPSSPNIARNTLIGLLLGLVLSVIIVILFAIADTTIRSEEDLTDAFQIPILGVIPRLSESEK